MDILDNYIKVIKNLIPNTLCDQILTEYANTNDWVDANTGGGIQKNIRNCHTIGLSHNNIIKDSAIRKKIDDDLFNIASQCIEKYNSNHTHAQIAEDTGYELLRYREGEFYSQHVDTFLQAPRLVSCSMHLNDDYEGGEFAFFDRQLKYKLNKGDVLMFPSTFMYPHEVMPVTQGTRYSIITWFR